MGKIFVFDMVSLDGYFAGPKGELDWHNVDTEFNEFAINQLTEVEMILFGEVTYEMMACYWTTDEAKKNDPIVAKLMNDLPKVVVSQKLKTADWSNTKIVRDDVNNRISELKDRAAKDIAIFGSSMLSVSLMEAGLIDELRIMVNPVILGKGRSIFDGLDSRLKLRLVSNRLFKSGNILLCYQPDKT